MASSPLPTLHFSSFPILHTWVLTPPERECPEEGEEKGGAGMFALDWLSCEVETAFSGPSKCLLSAGASFQESSGWVSGFHTWLSRLQFFDEGKCICVLLQASISSPDAISAAHQLLGLSGVFPF